MENIHDSSNIYIVALSKESVKEVFLNNAICSNMDEPRDWYTEWNKSDWERQTSYDIAYMWNLEK